MTVGDACGMCRQKPSVDMKTFPIQRDCLLKKLLMKFFGDREIARTHKIIHDAMKIILSSDLI